MKPMGTLGQRAFQMISVLVIAIGLLAIHQSLQGLLPDATVRGQVFNLFLVVTILMTVVMITAQAKSQYWATMKQLRPLLGLAEQMQRATDQLMRSVDQHELHSVEIETSVQQLREQVQTFQCPWQEVQTINHAIEQLAICLTRYWQHTTTLQTQAAKDDMAKQVAHDMRSPVQVLRSVLRWTRDHFPSADDGRKFVMADTALAKLEQMASDLCNVAKASKITRASVDVAALAQTTIESIRTTLSDERIVLHYVGPDTATVLLDADKFTRVLTNLLQNGVQAIAAEQSGAVTLSLSAADDVIHVVVHDTGSGMSEATQAKLFQRLFTTKGAGGTGLGLAYCKDVVVAHGGKIHVESALGQGSAFHMTIPTTILPTERQTLHVIAGGLQPT